MKLFLWICIALVVVGAVLLFFQPDSAFDTLPLPGAGLSVKMLAEVKTEAEYHLVVGMPVANLVPLSSETVPCSLTVRITQPNKEPINADVTLLTLGYEYGFARIRYYTGGGWQLKPGNYEIEIKSRESCKAAASRGATVSLDQKMTHPTERFLQGVLRHWCAVVFLWIGIVGLVICEFRKT